MMWNKHYYIPGMGPDTGPQLSDIQKIIHTFAGTGRIFFNIFLSIFILSTSYLIYTVNNSFLVQVPVSGGTLVEGIIGSPRFINPLLAVSEADKDLTELVYSGLMRTSPDGLLVPDLAEEIFVSDDGLLYEFVLRSDAKWHDGLPVTSDDVIFTIKLAKDPALKSPRRASWEGVTPTKIDERTVQIRLIQPYAPFLTNATLGILPSHIWQDITQEEFSFSTLNINPIGSGPYRVVNVKRNSQTGIPEHIELNSFKDFSLGKPYINRVIIRFYPNEEELISSYKDGKIDSVGGIPGSKITIIDNRSQLISMPLTRIFAVFFNQNEAQVLTSKSVRNALTIVIDQDKIIEKILGGYGTAINGPIPPGSLGFLDSKIISDTISATGTTQDLSEENISENESDLDVKILSKEERAIEILTMDGWHLNDSGYMTRSKKNEEDEEILSFSLSTAKIPELINVAEILKENWRRIGVLVDVKVSETGDLNQDVIRPRKYDALLFGEVVGRDPDPFAFWHSSQRLDPGLNIALYANISADKLLEKARTSSDQMERIKKYLEFQEEIKKDIPAIFLYSPDFLYLIPNKLKGVEVAHVTIHSDRFLNIYKWHIYTDKVWIPFNNN